MQKESVWSRVGAWLRGDPDDSLAGERHTTSAPSTSIATPFTGERNNGPDDSASVRAAPVGSPRSSEAGQPEPRASRAARTGPTRDGLEELVSSIKEHLESQVKSSDVLVDALDRLAEGIEGLPAAAKDEQQVLDRIGADLSSGLGALKRLESALAQVPKLADAQRETMVAVNSELSRLRETDEKIASALNGVQQIMVELRDGIGRSAGVMRDFRTEMAERHDHLAAVIEQQVQRFLKLAVVAVALGGLAVVLGLISLLR